MDTYSEYVDLLSTACLKTYPNNTNSRFTNDLVIPQKLPENTYVALEEIAYVHGIYNLLAKNSSLTIYDWFTEFEAGSPENPENFPTYGEYYNCPIHAGFYDSLEDICTMLNNAIKKSGSVQLKNRDVFSFDKVSMKFSYNLQNFWGTMFIRGDLLNILGKGYLQQKYMTSHERYCSMFYAVHFPF